MRTVIWILIIAVFTVGIVAAQDQDCPALVEQALEIVGNACTNLGRNQVCYGNFEADAEGRTGQPITFASAGDRVSVTDIASLTTSPLNQQDHSWGIVLMALQANLPETLPGQNVTFVAFGNVTVENDVNPDALRLSAAVKGNINVRSGPGTNFTKTGSLKNGEAITIIGRSSSNQWLQFLTDDLSGWVSASLLDVQGDIADLDVVDGSLAYVNPMQAFRIRSNSGGTSCDKAPPDAVLIQSPEGAKVNFLINDIEVTLGSTALIRLLSDGSLRVINLSGQVSVRSGGRELILAPGQAINVIAGQAPGKPDSYAADDVQLLPLSLLPSLPSVPPVILGVQTYTIVGDGAGNAIPISFLNADGDAIVKLRQKFISSTAGVGPSGEQDVTPADYDNPYGGTLGYAFGCSTNGTISITYEITIVDAAGNVSPPERYTITCTPP